jgi:hypothetical protein
VTSDQLIVLLLLLVKLVTRVQLHAAFSTHMLPCHGYPRVAFVGSLHAAAAEGKGCLY